jgi:hypothetical protein
MKLNLFLLSAAALVNAATSTATVDLGAADKYAILAKSGISTVPSSAITGDIAVWPIDSAGITAFGLQKDLGGGAFSKSPQVTGKALAYDYSAAVESQLITAVSDMETAYNNAEARGNEDKERTNIGGGFITSKTLTPGVYTFDVDINIGIGGVTLHGSDTDIFIFQTTGNILQAANTQVTLTGGALAKNIFWQAAGNVEVGAGAHFEGVLLVKKAVTFITKSSLNGRVFTQANCALQMATITEPAN